MSSAFATETPDEWKCPRELEIKIPIKPFTFKGEIAAKPIQLMNFILLKRPLGFDE